MGWNICPTKMGQAKWQKSRGFRRFLTGDPGKLQIAADRHCSSGALQFSALNYRDYLGKIFSFSNISSVFFWMGSNNKKYHNLSTQRCVLAKQTDPFIVTSSGQWHEVFLLIIDYYPIIQRLLSFIWCCASLR